MHAFDPARPCRSFAPQHAGRGRRRRTALHFVSQEHAGGEVRFVVKGYAAPGDAPGEASARLQRELDGQAAFRQLGEEVLLPCAGPYGQLTLQLDGRTELVAPALVYRYLPAPTLFDVLRTGGAGAEALLAEVVARLAARHGRARAVTDLHSDGAAHNVLVVQAPEPQSAEPARPGIAPAPRSKVPAPRSAVPEAARACSPAGGRAPALLWFDFAEPHVAAEAGEACAVELLAFLLSVVEASRAGAERARVALVCAAYPDRAVLRRVLALRTPPRPRWHALRHRLRLRSWLALWRGDTTQLARYRLFRALRAALAPPGS